MSSIATILHICDVHFGWEGDNPSQKAEREVCLEGLLREVSKLDREWKPSIICLTGDVGWRGAGADYEQATQWLDQLMRCCDLGYDRLIVCPGNHDVDRSEARKVARAATSKEADEVLEPPIAEQYIRPFSAYSDFCKKLGVPSVSLGNSDSYLVGATTLGDIRFLVVNSAWFAKADDDKNKLWLGLPQLKYLEAQRQLQLLEFDGKEPLTVALMHHPPEWLHEDEQHASGGRPNTRDYLAVRCHVLLSGHTHGEVRRADRIAEGAWHLTGGSAYAGASHFNTFRLLQLDREQIVHRSFEFDPSSAEVKWRASDASRLPVFRESTAAQSAPKAGVGQKSPNELRAALRADAIRMSEEKSRLLRPSGRLPLNVAREVSVRVNTQHQRFDPEGRLVRMERAEQIMPLYEAIRRSRRTLLLGDLGAGKSTLGAQLVIETIDRSATAVAAFVPAKELQLKDRFTTHQFLETIDDYLAEQVIPGGSPTDVRSLLENKTEVLLVIDGLDEVPQDVGGRILRQAATMPEHWPTTQIVATARPIEFAGVSYPDWRLAYTIPLDDDAKRKFIAEEMVADGVDAREGDDKANSLLRSLKEMPALDSIANSPLAIRLIYPRLRDSLSRESLTVGDLLYELLLERLGGWQKRDDKPATFDHFDAVLPTSEGKVELLAVLAQKAVANRRITVDEAKADLRDAAADIKDANKDRLADEALACFEWLGLIARGSVIEFPLQPLVEVSAAAGLLGRWRSQASDWNLPDHAQWRVVSFAAAIARRRGWLAELREPILRFINTLLLDARNVPATCYVVVEASDTVLAKKTVEILPRLGFRPLTVLGDEQRVSVRNIAKTLWLAGEPGFNWLFDHYLSPKYPISSGVGWMVRDVFEEWANLARGHLAETDRNRLTKLVKPYLATGEAQFFGVLTVLAVVVPEAFELDDRLWYQSLALDRALFSGRISEEFLTLGKSDGSPREHLNKVLQHRAAESERAAILWLELNSDIDPPASLIRQAFQSRLRRTASSTETELSFLCRGRLGEDRWLRFARWTVSMSDRSGAGAAIVLIDAGEKDLSMVGDALISAMHDGGYFAEAERVLDALVRTAGEKGLFWLGSRMAANWWDGAHSGCWRVLLSRIGEMKDGPEVLAKCVKNMGPYTLPRYPEVREAFLQLLDGPQGTEFRGALRAQLHSLDPDTRRGAALILTLADPRTEAEALFVAIRSRASSRSIDWHEWETFCLTLDFGPSVLSVLKSRLQFLEPHSRALALLILLKGGMDIEPRYRAELESSLLMIGNWHLARDHTAQAFLRGDNALAALITKLNYPNSEVAENAAGMLLDLYRGLLSPKVEGKCIAIRTKAGRWSLDLPKVMARIARDAEFAASIKEACEQIRQQRGAVPFLEFVLRANNDPSVWKDVVWSMLYDDTQAAGASSEADSNGEALLEYGVEVREHAKPIGEAAIECLNDPRTKAHRWIDAYQWLAVIGDEFVGLKADCIRDALHRGQPIRCSAAASLIARLDELPSGVVFRHATSRRPAFTAGQVQREADLDRIVARLKEYSRDSEDLHPALPATIEDCLYLPAVSETTLSQIASIGKPGILISNALRFCYGAPAKLAETLPLLDIWGKIWVQATNSPYLRQLLQLWMVVRESAIRGDEKVTNEYLATLDERLADGEMRKLPLASEILRIRGSLSKGQVGPVFLAYARYPSFLHEMLFGQLAKWLGGGTDEALKNEIIEAASNSLVVLDEAPWESSDGGSPNTWAYLLFPSILWALKGESSTAHEAVFLRGLRYIFEQPPLSHRGPAANVLQLLSALDPLLRRAPSHCLHATILSGLAAPEPTIRVVCLLIQSFAEFSVSGARMA